jgi:DNA-binding response OmpR family regulator
MKAEQRKEVGAVVLVSGAPQDDTAMAQSLSDAGYEISMLTEPKRVLSLQEMKPRGWLPSLIIVETVIPRNSGFELVRQLSSMYDNNKVSIAMMAKYESHEDKLEASSAGAQGLLVKPLTAEKIDDFVEKERMRRLKAQIGAKVVP